MPFICLYDAWKFYFIIISQVLVFEPYKYLHYIFQECDLSQSHKDGKLKGWLTVLQNVKKIYSLKINPL